MRKLKKVRCFCVVATQLGLPDVGLISLGEMVDQGHVITEAVSVPVIGDGDNGYGNSMNIKRTFKGYTNAGLAGIMLEDQAIPHAVTLDHQIRAGPRQAIEFIPQLITYLWVVVSTPFPCVSLASP